MPKRLAYLGPAGTNTEQAAATYDPGATRLPFDSIPAVASAVEEGKADEAIVPIENSLEGSVTFTLDLLIHESSLFIRHELVLPIHHYLLGGPGVETGAIEVIYSHPQALAQCRSFLSKRFSGVDLVASLSTATAVEEMQRSERVAAAIGTSRGAELYGAEVLARSIEDGANNETRFVVLAPTDHDRTGEDKTSICFSYDQDSPGSLHGTLGEFARLGINLTKIESRPTRESLGRYIFLVDLEGHREDGKVVEALERTRERVSMLKVFGSYPRYRAPTRE